MLEAFRWFAPSLSECAVEAAVRQHILLPLTLVQKYHRRALTTHTHGPDTASRVEEVNESCRRMSRLRHCTAESFAKTCPGTQTSEFT